MKNEQAHDAQRFDSEGKPTRMFFDARAALNFAQRLEKDDEVNKSPIRKQIMGMRNLAPPRATTPANSDQLNINWGEGKDALNERNKPFFIRLTQEPEPIDVRVWEPNPTIADDWGRDISRAASKALTQWTGSYRELSAAADDMGAYGLGVIIFPEEKSPIFERLPPRRVFFPAGSPPDVGCIDAVVVKYRWSATDIYAKWAMKDETAEALGWNKEALKRVMMEMHRAGNSRKQNQGSMPWEVIEEEIRENQMAQWITGNQVDVYMIVHRDFDETFGVSVVCNLVESVNGVRATNGLYLREMSKVYEALGQFICLFPLDPKQESIHGIQGYGHDLYPKSLVASRMKNALVEHWHNTTSVWWKTHSAEAAMRFQFTRRGAHMFAPSTDVEPMEMYKRDHMAEDFGVLGFMEPELQRNLPIHRPQNYGRSSIQRASATKEKIDQLDANQDVSVDVGFYEIHLDLLFDEFYRRLTLTGDPHKAGEKVRKVFLDELEFLEVDRKIFKYDNIRQIKAKRTVGPGSPFAKQQAADALMAIRGALPPEGQHEVLELFVSSRTGGENVRRFVPDFERLNEPTYHNWQANQESLAIRQSGGVPILAALGSQNDGVHIEQHIVDFRQEIEAAASGQGGDAFVMQIAPVFNVLVFHLDSHIARLEADETRKSELEALKPQVEQLRRLALSMDRQARQLSEVQRRAEEAALAAQGPTMDPKVQADVEKKQFELQASQAKTAQEMQQKEARFQQDTRHKEISYQQELRQAEAEAVQKAAKQRSA